MVPKEKATKIVQLCDKERYLDSNQESPMLNGSILRSQKEENLKNPQKTTFNYKKTHKST